jgi:hypothetical protein
MMTSVLGYSQSCLRGVVTCTEDALPLLVFSMDVLSRGLDWKELETMACGPPSALLLCCPLKIPWEGEVEKFIVLEFFENGCDLSLVRWVDS